MEIQNVDAVEQSAAAYHNVNSIQAELRAHLDSTIELSKEFKFFLDLLQRRGGLALELGSGTGVRLLHYLATGIHVHGVETSLELFTLCQARAKKIGMVPTIHRQQLDRLDIPMSFKTIYAPQGLFNRIGSSDVVEIVLQRLFEHLEMNGQLVIVLDAPRIHSLSQAKLGVWQIVHRIDRQDQSTILHSQVEQYNFVQQKIEILNRYEIFRSQGVVETILGASLERWYYKTEFEFMLERAGFSEIMAVGDYSLDPLADEHKIWVFFANKRG